MGKLKFISEDIHQNRKKEYNIPVFGRYFVDLTLFAKKRKLYFFMLTFRFGNFWLWKCKLSSNVVQLSQLRWISRIQNQLVALLKLSSERICDFGRKSKPIQMDASSWWSTTFNSIWLIC